MPLARHSSFLITFTIAPISIYSLTPKFRATLRSPILSAFTFPWRAGEADAVAPFMPAGRHGLRSHVFRFRFDEKPPKASRRPPC